MKNENKIATNIFSGAWNTGRTNIKACSTGSKQLKIENNIQFKIPNEFAGNHVGTLIKCAAECFGSDECMFFANAAAEKNCLYYATCIQKDSQETERSTIYQRRNQSSSRNTVKNLRF